MSFRKCGVGGEDMKILAWIFIIWSGAWLILKIASAYKNRSSETINVGFGSIIGFIFAGRILGWW